MESPANHDKPLLFVDVDGVISLYGFEPDNRPPGSFQTVEGIPHYLSATAGDHLRALAAHFVLTWCTGWEERANEYLPQALGLPGELPCLTFTDPPQTGAHWKLRAIDRHAGPDQALAWIDDAHSAACHEWAAARAGPTLLVTTAPRAGLTEQESSRLVEWAGSLRARPR